MGGKNDLWKTLYIKTDRPPSLKRKFMSRYSLFKMSNIKRLAYFERGKMLNWLKRLFKREKQIGFMDIEIEIKELKPIARYNIRGKNGRFVKKGKKNGNRR